MSGTDQPARWSPKTVLRKRAALFCSLEHGKWGLLLLGLLLGGLVDLPNEQLSS